MKIENWNGHDIRFVEKEPGEWWAVARDVADALGYVNTSQALADNCRWVSAEYIPQNVWAI